MSCNRSGFGWRRVVATVAWSLGAVAAWAAPGRFTPIGPEGGSLAAIAVDPLEARVVYAASETGGGWKSTDGGESWRRLSSLPGARDLIVDPTAPQTLYAVAGNQVLRSPDGGLTFVDASAGLSPEAIVELALDPLHPAVLYAATQAGLYKTVDGGGSWQPAHPDSGGYETAVALDPQAPETLFVGDLEEGLWKSTDGGATWARKTAGLPPASAGDQIVDVAVDPDVAGRVFAVFTPFSPAGPALPPQSFRSTDAGETWAAMPGGEDTPLAVGHGGLVLAGSRRSADGGLTWTASGVPGAPVVSLAVAPGDPAVVYAGPNERAIVRSTDAGQTWQRAGGGLWMATVTGLAVSPRPPGVLYAGIAGERLWALPLAPGGAWRLQSEGDEIPVSDDLIGLTPDPRTPRLLYARAGSSRTLFKSRDGGRSFFVLRPPTISADCLYFGGGLALDAGSSDVLYTGVDGASTATCLRQGCVTARSTDGGTSWSCMPDLPRLRRIDAHPSRPGTVFAVSGAGFWGSRDFGASWRLLLPSWLGDIRALAFDPRQADVLYAGFGDSPGRTGVWRSPDGGLTWRRLSRNLQRPVTALIVDPRAPSILYAGVATGAPDTGAGVYRSTDSGRTWSLLPGLPETLFSGQLAFDPIHGTLYAGTHGQGIFAASLPAR